LSPLISFSLKPTIHGSLLAHFSIFFPFSFYPSNTHCIRLNWSYESSLPSYG
jgi:hypothetical protein